MKTINKLLIILFIFSNLIVLGEETQWIVPQDKDSKTAPEMFTNEMVKAGNNLYQMNCKSCHGDIGANNMIKLDPLPKDLSTVGAQSDGSFYYKINEGRGAMPNFKNTLSISDKWAVISYVRSFHADYVQAKPHVAVVFAGGGIKLSLEYIEETKQFKVSALGKEKDKEVCAEGVEVSLFAERYFGNMKLGDNKMTNKEGVALFALPKNLPGDSIGTLRLIAKVADPELYGEVSVREEITAGIHTNKPSLTEKRAMWNVVSKAPLWITFAYPLSVLSVLTVLGYILLLLKRIYVLGKNESDNKE